MKASLAFVLVAYLCFISSVSEMGNSQAQDNNSTFSLRTCATDFVYGYSLGLQVSQELEGVCIVGFTSMKVQYNSFLTAMGTYQPFENTIAFINLFEEFVNQINRCSVGDFFQTLREMAQSTWELLGVQIASRMVTFSATLTAKGIKLMADIAAANCSGVGEAVGFLLRIVTGFNLP